MQMGLPTGFLRLPNRWKLGFQGLGLQSTSPKVSCSHVKPWPQRELIQSGLSPLPSPAYQRVISTSNYKGCMHIHGRPSEYPATRPLPLLLADTTRHSPGRPWRGGRPSTSPPPPSPPPASLRLDVSWCT